MLATALFQINAIVEMSYIINRMNLTRYTTLKNNSMDPKLKCRPLRLTDADVVHIT